MNLIFFSILMQVSVSIPDDSAKPTQVVVIPINVSDLTGLEVYSSDITVHYKPAVLTADSVIKTGTILLPSWSMFYNDSVSGEVKISMAGADALSGAGALVKIAFHVPDSAIVNDTGRIYFTKMMLNEGDPSCITSTGLFTVAPVGIDENKYLMLNVELKAEPNPFCGKTVIKFENSGLKIKGCKIQIYDVSGKGIRTFCVNQCQSLTAVRQVVSWDGRDDSGNLLTNGIYFCKLTGETNKSLSPLKLILMR